jgi:hypothetical protein
LLIDKFLLILRHEENTTYRATHTTNNTRYCRLVVLCL